MSRRKRAILRRFLGGRPRLPYVEDSAAVDPGSVLFLWGSEAEPPGLPEEVRIVRVEDGFLRSVGLGADLVRPLSWILDGRGIYYDATRPSDLEHMLSTAEFPPPLLERAARLRQRLVAHGLTKYNIDAGDWRRPKTVARVILVPGQVETDASIRFGAPGVRTNLGLVQAVRQANPGAYLVYKPHPDVLAGLRAAGRDEEGAREWCDEIVAGVPIARLLDAVDEVHVLTSLAGFEALQRNKPVVCHGQPFYAGWGLTEDRVPVARRQRRLALDALLAAALILYPLYLGRSTRRPATPERAVEELLAWKAAVAPGIPLWRSAFRVVLRRVVGVR
jgi:capsular polysaccharide export protein